jgi:hypothetical protein
MAVFIERSTEDHKWRYKLAGGGRLQKLSGLGKSAEVKATGGWDVAFPIEGYGAALGESRVDRAYMTMQDYDRHLDTVMIQDVNTVRYEVLRALFNNTQETFVDPHYGNLLVEPLANGDAVVYPPVLGSEAEATDTHYLASGYTSANISDSNNPFPTVRDELVEHFGVEPGGSNIVAFINQAQRAKVEALTEFNEVPDRYVRPGDNTAVPIGLPTRLPGTIIGRTTSGVWVSEWRWVPADYLLAVHMDAVKPLVQRYDPADTGLPRGLALVAEDERYPLKESYWEHRFGLGCGNRLNGVFMLFTAGGFSVPSGY